MIFHGPFLDQYSTLPFFLVFLFTLFQLKWLCITGYVVIRTCKPVEKHIASARFKNLGLLS